jgi:hypothetical protein
MSASMRHQYENHDQYENRDQYEQYEEIRVNGVRVSIFILIPIFIQIMINSINRDVEMIRQPT